MVVANASSSESLVHHARQGQETVDSMVLVMSLATVPGASNRPACSAVGFGAILVEQAFAQTSSFSRPHRATEKVGRALTACFGTIIQTTGVCAIDGSAKQVCSAIVVSVGSWGAFACFKLLAALFAFGFTVVLIGAKAFAGVILGT